MSNYHTRIKKRSRNTIIGKLSQQPLTFTELLEETGLSRGVLNKHLKFLELKGTIEKKYDSGKIVNVLVSSEFDLIEWFLDQLRDYEIPEEVLEKGKEILSKKAGKTALISAASLTSTAIANIATNISQGFLALMDLVPKKTKTKKLKKFRKQFGKNMLAFPIFSSKIKHKKFDLQLSINSPEEAYKEEVFFAALNELNPFGFTIVLTIYWMEKNFFLELLEHLENEEIEKFNEIEYLFCWYPVIKKNPDIIKSLDEMTEWWFSEVSEYLPNNAVFGSLAALYNIAAIVISGCIYEGELKVTYPEKEKPS